jgi:hypothetical protein
MFDYDEGPDPEDMTWLFPERGPGKFKNLKDKKKKKGKKGKKKSKKSSKE